MTRKSGTAPNMWAVPLVLSCLILYENADLAAGLRHLHHANIYLIDILKILIGDDLLRVAADQLAAPVQDCSRAARSQLDLCGLATNFLTHSVSTPQAPPGDKQFKKRLLYVRSVP